MPQKPTKAEIEAIFKEENDAVLAFIEVSDRETQVAMDKTKARHRLDLARERKREIIQDLISAIQNPYLMTNPMRSREDECEIVSVISSSGTSVYCNKHGFSCFTFTPNHE